MGSHPLRRGGSYFVCVPAKHGGFWGLAQLSIDWTEAHRRFVATELSVSSSPAIDPASLQAKAYYLSDNIILQVIGCYSLLP